MTITRPETVYDDPSHTYTLNGEELLSVSGVAKIGGAESTWSVASSWGFKIGWRGALAILSGEDCDPLAFTDQADERGAEPAIHWPEQEALYQALKAAGRTPWSVRDAAADRGTWTHDLLERLGQEGEVVTAVFLDGFSEEYRGHARGTLDWFLKFRPVFVATEVQVTSVEHGFSGRYDIRCLISGDRLIANNIQEINGILIDPRVMYLVLVDLKTSKGIYPTQHFPQLSGYEGASVEMGFPPTDFQFVLNTHPDGTFDFAPSWSVFGDFLAYLGALKAIRRIEANDPVVKQRIAREQAILGNLPGRSATLAVTVPELAGMDGRGVGILMGGLRKRGLVEQRPDKTWELVVPAG